jgi:hypothetical protein
MVLNPSASLLIFRKTPSMIGGIVKLTLTEIMRELQDFGTFIVIILLAYVVYKAAILLEAMSDKIKGEKD